MNGFLLDRLLLWVILAGACGPSIKAFDITPIPKGPGGGISSSALVETCAGEPLAVQWETKGETALVLRLGSTGSATNEEGVEPGLLAPDTLVVTLVAGPPSKEVVRTIFVLQFPDMSKTVIAFPTTLRGDTLVAAGERGETIDERFTVSQILNPTERPLRVSHTGTSADLDGGAESNAFAGNFLGGAWEFRTLMTEDEQDNPRSRPTSLRIQAMVHCQSGAS